VKIQELEVEFPLLISLNFCIKERNQALCSRNLAKKGDFNIEKVENTKELSSFTKKVLRFSRKNRGISGENRGNRT